MCEHLGKHLSSPCCVQHPRLGQGPVFGLLPASPPRYKRQTGLGQAPAHHSSPQPRGHLPQDKDKRPLEPLAQVLQQPSSSVSEGYVMPSPVRGSELERWGMRGARASSGHHGPSTSCCALVSLGSVTSEPGSPRGQVPASTSGSWVCVHSGPPARSQAGTSARGDRAHVAGASLAPASSRPARCVPRAALPPRGPLRAAGEGGMCDPAGAETCPCRESDGKVG